MPVAIAVDTAEKIGKFLAHDNLGFTEIVQDYYIPFVVFYANTFMPLALFISTILFTSKLAGNTEIVAIHSAGISFKRFLKPYLLGATIIAVVALFANHFVVPRTNGTFEEFQDNYTRRTKRSKTSVKNVSLQLTENDFVYFRTYDLKRNIGYDFSYEKFDGLQLKYKLIARNIRYSEEDSVYTLSNYKERFVLARNDSIYSSAKLDTTFNFKPQDLLYTSTLAKAMNSFDLNVLINKSEKRGVSNLNQYKVELYKRTSLPISSFILTLIAVVLASKKRRGGVGINLAFGVAVMFSYVFFLKVFEVLGASATSNPLLMVWIPNILFGILAAYLYSNARR
ncbi:MAG: LptF/LptG family permease [Flavobacteriaceae bacterium]|nr:LptF/LptG family permease [Flavobacteriaceae bacterium]